MQSPAAAFDRPYRRAQQMFAALLLVWVPALVQAQPPRAAATPTELPAVVLDALAKARLPAQALSVYIAEAQGAGTPLLMHRAQASVNPASTAKLVTTFAALERLGPTFRWRTTVYTDGPVVGHTLQGNLYIRGGGDPTLVAERLWLLMRQIQALGIRQIQGDLVIDRSLFRLPETDPAAFDGEPLRPYNAQPDALLISHKALTFTFTPDVQARVARIGVEPPLAGVDVPDSVALTEAPCENWRSLLQADFSNPRRPHFKGAYPSTCGSGQWPVAYPEPSQLTARALLGTWQLLGGTLGGTVHDGSIPAQAQARITLESPPLSEVIRDINKFSNNVMAQHVFLALAHGNQPDRQDVNFQQALEEVQTWWRERLGDQLPSPLLSNGSGLSRDDRVTAEGLAQVLQLAYRSAFMPELMASLPLSGWDGTLRRSPIGQGMAHLKTGSLRDVQALAGYVHGPDGRRRVFVAIVNHPEARAARPVLDALVRWTAERP